MTEVEKANAPAINLSTKEVDMSAILAKKSKSTSRYYHYQYRASPLQINKLQVFHPAVGVNLKKSVLQPGESTRLRGNGSEEEYRQEAPSSASADDSNDPDAAEKLKSTSSNVLNVRNVPIC